MQFKKIFISLIFITIQLSLIAQNVAENKIWTLKECVDYALENNISIKQSELDKLNQYQDVKNAKGNFLPNLNASASQSFNFGSAIDVTGNRVAADFRSNNYSLNSNVVLFDGFANIYTLNQAQINVAVQEANITKMKNDISLNVVNAYLQVLFAKEQIKIAQFQVDISTTEVDRITSLVNAGLAPKGDLLNIKATLGSDEQTLIDAQNNFDMATLRLAQLLQLPDGTIAIEEIELKDPNNSIISNESSVIYEKAAISFPEIKAAELTIESAEKGVKISKANYLPSLSFNYSLSTVYQHQQGFSDFFTHSEQLDNNLGHFLGLSLNIPIFNRFQFRTSVTRAEINMERAKNNLESEKLRLRESVQIAYTDAKSASKSFEASKKSVEAQNEAFKYAQERFQVGNMNAFDFNQTKNRLFTAESQLLRSKYDYTFKIKVLEFYYGVPFVTE
ncbi:MAG: TolC family protein [Vicingaceae bacterium]|nr:TolC family protein [Vicingaceae bacterium]